jgi:hypothetical protein
MTTLAPTLAASLVGAAVSIAAPLAPRRRARETTPASGQATPSSRPTAIRRRVLRLAAAPE